MQWLLAFHLIFMVAWFSGLFYLPRLFVYHAMAADQISQDRFKIMEYRLFWVIMTPAGVLTTLFGHWLFALHETVYLHTPWMLLKLCCVALLWFYHGFCWFLMRRFQQNRDSLSSTFYRFFNEIPTVLLATIIILVVVKPAF